MRLRHGHLVYLGPVVRRKREPVSPATSGTTRLRPCDVVYDVYDIYNVYDVYDGGDARLPGNGEYIPLSTNLGCADVIRRYELLV